MLDQSTVELVGSELLVLLEPSNWQVVLLMPFFLFDTI